MRKTIAKETVINAFNEVIEGKSASKEEKKILSDMRDFILNKNKLLKKTVHRDTIIKALNQELADESISTKVKGYVSAVCEHILLSNNAYAGFEFINPDSKLGDDDYYNRKYF